jgi:hypothetical protein
MQSPTTRDDISSREESNHVEREANANIGKKGKFIQMKGTTSTLFGVENDLPNRSRACTVMAGNGTRRSSEKYRREVVWKMLFLLQLLLELEKKNSSKFK